MVFFGLCCFDDVFVFYSYCWFLVFFGCYFCGMYYCVFYNCGCVGGVYFVVYLYFFFY